MAVFHWSVSAQVTPKKLQMNICKRCVALLEQCEKHHKNGKACTDSDLEDMLKLKSSKLVHERKCSDEEKTRHDCVGRIRRNAGPRSNR